MTTAIQWTDATWNPAVGCTHISPGCDHCYAATVASRQMQPAHVGLTIGRRWNDTVRLLPDRLGEPLKWRKPRRVFVGSMTDLFHHDVPYHFLVRTWATMARAPQHTFQVLTKRPQRAHEVLAAAGFAADVELYVVDDDGQSPLWYGDPDIEDIAWLPNVWLGTSIENQTYAWRARHLAATPAAIRFLSVEPLIGPVTLDLTGIHWVIVGCESGPGRRRCHLSWVRDIRDQCAAASVALFVKQLTSDDGGIAYDDRVLHDIDDFPPDLKIREWPT